MCSNISRWYGIDEPEGEQLPSNPPSSTSALVPEYSTIQKQKTTYSRFQRVPNALNIVVNSFLFVSGVVPKFSRYFPGVGNICRYASLLFDQWYVQFRYFFHDHVCVRVFVCVLVCVHFCVRVHGHIYMVIFNVRLFHVPVNIHKYL